MLDLSLHKLASHAALAMTPRFDSDPEYLIAMHSDTDRPQWRGHSVERDLAETRASFRFRSLNGIF